MMNGQQSAALRGGFRHGGVHRPRLDSGVQGIHPGVHQPRRCYCVVISGCVVASGRGGFPKIRPCRWRCAALRPPAYVSAQKGTGKQGLGGLDPGWTPEASPGVHLGISLGSPERTTPSISPWIPSEGRSVSPSGVSQKSVSNALAGLTHVLDRSADVDSHRRPAIRARSDEAFPLASETSQRPEEGQIRSSYA